LYTITDRTYGNVTSVTLQPLSTRPSDALPGRRPLTAIACLHAMFFLTGAGTLLLGPMLPVLSPRWGLHDKESGLLLGMQFLGAFLGAMTLGPDLQKNLTLGCAAIVLGFGCVAVAAETHSGFVLGLGAFTVAGFGLGRTITSINLIVGRRFSDRRASALSVLNLTWGIGALLGPVGADLTERRYGIAGMFAFFAGACAIVATASLICLRQSLNIATSMPRPHSAPAARERGEWRLTYFGAAFFLYGGFEGSLSGWLATLSTRMPGGTVRLGAAVTTCLWMGLALGRAAAALLLLRVSERVLMPAGLALSGILSLYLLGPIGSGAVLAVLAGSIGLGFAPVFPSLCALLLVPGASVRGSGTVMALSALGGAVFPWLVGDLSGKTGSLQHGLWVPVGLCGLLAILLPRIFTATTVRGVP
jgi:FHS family glucose/mannose:H+ symporter-like MFS transporter